MKTKPIIRILYWIFIGICLQIVINLSMIISSFPKQMEERETGDPFKINSVTYKIKYDSTRDDRCITKEELLADTLFREVETNPIFIIDTTNIILPRLETDPYYFNAFDSSLRWEDTINVVEYSQVTDTIISLYPYDFDYDYKKVVYVAIDTIRKVDTASLFAYHCTHYGEIYTEIETDSCVLFIRQHINLF